jgi:hypothetical protein
MMMRGYCNASRQHFEATIVIALDNEGCMDEHAIIHDYESSVYINAFFT